MPRGSAGIAEGLVEPPFGNAAARGKKSTTSGVSFRLSRTMHMPPPARLAAEGIVAVSAKAIAVAASAALPPDDKMSRAIIAACGSSTDITPNAPDKKPMVPRLTSGSSSLKGFEQPTTSIAANDKAVI